MKALCLIYNRLETNCFYSSPKSVTKGTWGTCLSKTLFTARNKWSIKREHAILQSGIFLLARQIGLYHKLLFYGLFGVRKHQKNVHFRVVISTAWTTLHFKGEVQTQILWEQSPIVFCWSRKPALVFVWSNLQQGRGIIHREGLTLQEGHPTRDGLSTQKNFLTHHHVLFH